MIRYSINWLYIQLERAWFKLREEKKDGRNARVLLLPKPSPQKYILYRCICDATSNNNQGVKNLNKLISTIKSTSQKVIQIMNSSESFGWQQQGDNGTALAAQVPEALRASASGSELDDLDLIYFIVYQTKKFLIEMTKMS